MSTQSRDPNAASQEWTAGGAGNRKRRAKGKSSGDQSLTSTVQQASNVITEKSKATADSVTQAALTSSVEQLGSDLAKGLQQTKEKIQQPLLGQREQGSRQGFTRHEGGTEGRLVGTAAVIDESTMQPVHIDETHWPSVGAERAGHVSPSRPGREEAIIPAPPTLEAQVIEGTGTASHTGYVYMPPEEGVDQQLQFARPLGHGKEQGAFAGKSRVSGAPSTAAGTGSSISSTIPSYLPAMPSSGIGLMPSMPSMQSVTAPIQRALQPVVSSDLGTRARDIAHTVSESVAHGPRVTQGTEPVPGVPISAVVNVVVASTQVLASGLTNMAEALAEAMPIIGTKARQAAEAVVEAAPQVAAVASQAGHRAAAVASQAEHRLEEAIPAVTARTSIAAHSLGQFAQDVQETVAQAAHNVAGDVANAAQTVRGVVGHTASAVTETAANAAEAVAETAATAAERARQAAKTATGVVSEATSTAANKVTGAVSSAGQKAASVGSRASEATVGKLQQQQQQQQQRQQQQQKQKQQPQATRQRPVGGAPTEEGEVQEVSSRSTTVTREEAHREVPLYRTDEEVAADAAKLGNIISNVASSAIETAKSGIASILPSTLTSTTTGSANATISQQGQSELQQLPVMQPSGRSRTRSAGGGMQIGYSAPAGGKPAATSAHVPDMPFTAAGATPGLASLTSAAHPVEGSSPQTRQEM